MVGRESCHDPSTTRHELRGTSVGMTNQKHKHAGEKDNADTLRARRLAEGRGGEEKTPPSNTESGAPGEKATPEEEEGFFDCEPLSARRFAPFEAQGKQDGTL